MLQILIRCNRILESVSAGFIHLGYKQAISKGPPSPEKKPPIKCKHTKQMNPGREGGGAKGVYHYELKTLVIKTIILISY